MRNKNSYSKTPFPLLSPLPRLYITPNFSTSTWQQCRNIENGSWGQSIVLSLLFLPAQWDNLRSLPQGTVLHELLTVWVSPMGCSSSGGAPAWVPFHVLLPFRNRLLYCGFPQGHSPLWASSCSVVVSSTHCRWISAPLWSAGYSCLTMDRTQDDGEPQLWCLKHLLLSLPDLRISRSVLLTWCPSFLCSCTVFFFTLLTLLSQRCHHHCWRPVASASWSWLSSIRHGIFL